MIKIIFVCLVASIIGCTLTPKNLQESKIPVYDSTLRDSAQKKGVLIGTSALFEPFELLTFEEEYGNLIAKEYNVLTPEVSLRFDVIHPGKEFYDFSGADELIEFAETNNMKVRGHTLVWHRQLPDWLTKTDWTRDELIKVLRDHIHSVVGRYKGRIYAWDVVNEAHSNIYGLRNNMWKKIIGPEYIEMAFRFAHEADPNTLLFYNDHAAEDMEYKSDAIYKMIRKMIKNDVPIHGVGFQSHFLIGFYEPKIDEIRKNMERLIDLGLEIHITEMDVSVFTMFFKATKKDVARQAEIYSDMLELCLSIDKCTTFIMWGLTDKYSWIPEEFPGYSSGLIFDKDYQPKLAYNSMYNLFLKGR